MKKKKPSFTTILLIFGIFFIFMGIAFFSFTVLSLSFSEVNKDLSEYEYTYGTVDYKKKSSDDGDIYIARVTYLVNGEEYTWISNASSSKKLSAYPEYSSVKVYYKFNNPSDNAVPEISAEYDKILEQIKVMSQYFLVIGAVLVLICIVKILIKLAVVSVIIGTSKNTNLNNRNYNNNNYYPQNNNNNG